MTVDIARPARPVLGVSIAVFREGRVLLASRTKPPFAGAFSLPGGHVEADETLEQAALRELSEEVEITARVIGFNQIVETVRWANAHQLTKHFVIASFVGVWVSGEGRANPEEVGSILWATPEEVRRLTTTPGIPDIVENASRILALHHA